MNKYYRFKADQSVKLWDGFIDSYHYGIVVKAKKGTVTISWLSGNEKTYERNGEDNVWRDLQVLRSK